MNHRGIEITVIHNSEMNWDWYICERVSSIRYTSILIIQELIDEMLRR